MKNSLFVLVLIVAVLAVGATAYLYNELNTLKNNPEQVSQEEVEQLVVEVGRLMILPEETPTVATVADAEVLKKDQLFFANASNGDKILIYTTARKAILYNPTAKKIVEVAPIILGEGEGTPPAATTPPPPAPAEEVMEEETPSDETVDEEAL